MFFENSQNSKESTSARVFWQVVPQIAWVNACKLKWKVFYIYIFLSTQAWKETMDQYKKTKQQCIYQ